MKNSYNKKSKLLKKVLLIIIFYITFFSYSNNIFGASFKYSDFDFDEFAEANLGYWSSICVNKDQGTTEKCVELILSRQEKFYTRLYKVLASYQNKKLVIDDKILLTTVFFELDPDLFTDEIENETYKKLFGKDFLPFKIDINSDEIDDKNDDPNYFETETDTIKTLAKAMIGYPYACYGIVADPITETVTNNDGSTSETSYCGTGDETYIDNNLYCTTTLEKGALSFWEKLLDNFKLASLLGIKSGKQKKCEEELNIENNMQTIYDFKDKEEIMVEKYWEFLLESNYLDKKAHLQYRYSSILKETNHKYMIELNDSELEEYSEKITKVRSHIIDNIKWILENYGEEDMHHNFITTSSFRYWWPIGSASEPDSIFAADLPVSINISSEYGKRKNPKKKDEWQYHSGIDLTTNSEVGIDNVIASKDGIVTQVVNNCVSYGESSCGGKYGNYVIITHADGFSTLYAHLHENTITVSINEAVKQGQIIGKIGSSGNSTGPHLHFEIRNGDNQQLNPKEYIDPDDPRPSGGNQDFIAALICMEGPGGEDGQGNYEVYDDKYGSDNKETDCEGKPIIGTLTVGPGITLKYQKNRFAQYNINSMACPYYKVGGLISKEIVENIKSDIISNHYDSIRTMLASSGIVLEENQIDALVSRMYNTGNIDGFVAAYKQYGNTEALFTNYFIKKSKGLENRRSYEWDLFHNGIYPSC